MANKVSQPGIREAMPLLVSNEGVWEGWYRYYDARTGLTDRPAPLAPVLPPDRRAGA